MYMSHGASVPSVVTPNAIRRNLTRVLGTIPYCFREVGSALFPGFYLDRPFGDLGGDAYDTDALVFQGTFPATVLGPNLAATAKPQATFAVTNAALLLGARYILVSGTEVMFVLAAAGNTLTVQRGVMGTQPVFHFAGDSITPVFEEHERAAFVDAAGNGKASGWFGEFDAGTNRVTIARLQGSGAVVAAGDQVVGLHSGARFNVTSSPALAPDAFRFHPLLDYEQMRACFLVGVPRVGFGEFGFAWGLLPAGDAGNHPDNFLDAAPGPNFLDGFPVGAAAFYGRVWAALQKAKAGGVSAGLYLAGEGCV